MTKHELSDELRKLSDVEVHKLYSGFGWIEEAQDALRRAADALDQLWVDFLALNDHYASVCGNQAELDEEFDDAKDRAEKAEARVEDLAMLLRRLLACEKSSDLNGRTVANQAWDYLKRHDLEGKPMRQALEETEP